MKGIFDKNGITDMYGTNLFTQSEMYHNLITYKVKSLGIKHLHTATNASTCIDMQYF